MAGLAVDVVRDASDVARLVFRNPARKNAVCLKRAPRVRGE
jgi:hypothetical protein